MKSLSVDDAEIAETDVILQLTNEPQRLEEGRNTPVVNASALVSSDWGSLILECSQNQHYVLRFLVSRDLLKEKSTFFQSLFGGNFRESSDKNIRINWDMAAFCCLLQYICSGELNIHAFLIDQILEGILFFGVESALVNLLEIVKGGQLTSCISKLWSVANAMGIKSIADMCLETIAVNFEDAIKQNTEDVPTTLLAACIDHTQLTVTSEKALCDTLLHWWLYTATPDGPGDFNKESVELQRNVQRVLQSKIHLISDPAVIEIFQKIRVLLLPPDFILGPLYQHCPAHFLMSKGLPLSGYDELMASIEKIDCKGLLHSANEELCLRLTEQTAKIDLTGCIQITVAILFHSVLHLQRRNAVTDSRHYLKLERGVEEVLLKDLRHSKSILELELSRDLCMRNLCHLILDGCWKLEQESLVIWLHIVCPNLKTLNLSHCPQLKINILPEISRSCESLETVDLSLHFQPPPTRSSHVNEVTPRNTRSRYQDPGWHTALLTRLTSLSLQGRSSLVDWDLQVLSRCCPNLSEINLGGCFLLTDQGISVFLANVNKLVVLECAYTSFGSLSADVLVRKQKHSPTPEISSYAASENITESVHILRNLNLEGCCGINEESISTVLQKASSLINLNMGFTSVGDRALLSFEGASLQVLNLQETQVSRTGLSKILKSNLNIKVLNIRGCRNILCPTDSDSMESLAKCLNLSDMAVGWGVSDYTMKAWRPAIHSLQSLSVGMGANISEMTFGTLCEACPLLKKLSLSFQVLYGQIMFTFLRNVSTLEHLKLSYCLGEVPQSILGLNLSNLSCLSLERGVTWMTDADILLLSRNCKSLTQLTLVGCRLLTSASFTTITQIWRGMIKIHLEECGTMTSDGATSLFACKALHEACLKHNGQGLDRSYALRALSELPLLQHLSLDMCDSNDQGYDTPNAFRKALSTLEFHRCKVMKNSFGSAGLQHHKDTILIEWDDIGQRTRIIA